MNRSLVIVFGVGAVIAGTTLVACSGDGEEPKVLGATVTTSSIPPLTIPTTTTTRLPTLAEWVPWTDVSNPLIDVHNDAKNRVVSEVGRDADVHNGRYFSEVADALRLFGIAMDEAGDPPSHGIVVQALRLATRDYEVASRAYASCFGDAGCNQAWSWVWEARSSWGRAWDGWLDACDCRAPAQ